MTPIKDIIKKIRIAIHDEDAINYDERDILNVVNAAMRFIRRTIAEIQPELIMTTSAGILQAGNDTIKLQHIPIKIVELTAGDKVISSTEHFASKKVRSNFDKVFGNATRIYSRYDTKIFDERPLEETNFQHIRRKSAEGKPHWFYREGLKNLKVYPKPKKETAYTVRMIDDIEELKLHDSTPFMSEFDDFLIEYATIRLSISNEYDMTQEQQIFANIHAQISQLLMPPPAGVMVRGYW